MAAFKTFGRAGARVTFRSPSTSVIESFKGTFVSISLGKVDKVFNHEK